jgi:hypothetical protein
LNWQTLLVGSIFISMPPLRNGEGMLLCCSQCKVHWSKLCNFWEDALTCCVNYHLNSRIAKVHTWFISTAWLMAFLCCWNNLGHGYHTQTLEGW